MGEKIIFISLSLLSALIKNNIVFPQRKNKKKRKPTVSGPLQSQQGSGISTQRVDGNTWLKTEMIKCRHYAEHFWHPFKSIRNRAASFAILFDLLFGEKHFNNLHGCY